MDSWAAGGGDQARTTHRRRTYGARGARRGAAVLAVSLKRSRPQSGTATGLAAPSRDDAGCGAPAATAAPERHGSALRTWGTRLVQSQVGAVVRKRPRTSARGAFHSRAGVGRAAGGAGAGQASQGLCFIDLGQRNAGPVTCKRCGMSYTAGLDDTNHKSFCAKLGQPPALPHTLWRSVAQKLAVGAPFAVKGDATGEVYVHSLRVPHGRMEAVVAATRALMANDMGACDPLTPSQQVFLAVTRKPRRVVGCVITDAIKEAWRVLAPTVHQGGVSSSPPSTPQPGRLAAASPVAPAAGTPASAEQPTPQAAVEVPASSDGAQSKETLATPSGAVPSMLSDMASLRLSSEARPATLGVCYMWTHKAWRRRGVARQLLDRVAEFGTYPALTSRGDLAFSHPTAAGRRLAEAFTGRQDFLVYTSTVTGADAAGLTHTPTICIGPSQQLHR